jgi:flagellar biosynthesis protein FliQ
MKYNGFQWSLKAWLSSALLTSIITIPIVLAIGRSLASSFIAWLVGSLYIAIPMLLVSLIPWLIVLLFLRRIVNSRLSAFVSKLIVFMVVIMLPSALFFTGLMSYKSPDWTAMIVLLAYFIASALSIWFYKLESGNDSLVIPVNP